MKLFNWRLQPLNQLTEYIMNDVFIQIQVDIANTVIHIIFNYRFACEPLLRLTKQKVKQSQKTSHSLLRYNEIHVRVQIYR